MPRNQAVDSCGIAATGTTGRMSNPNDDDDNPPLPAAVSANTLARYFGVSPKVIYDLAKAGVIERAPGRLFPLEDSVRRYCEHLRSRRNI
jgi:hypothetical protein